MNALKTSLKTNGFFSSLSGIFLLLFKSHFKAFFELQNDKILALVGVSLILFAGLILMAVKSQNKKIIQAIIIQDLAWVLTSCFFVLKNPFEFSISALYLIGIVALIVFGLAIWQYQTLRTALL